MPVSQVSKDTQPARPGRGLNSTPLDNNGVTSFSTDVIKDKCLEFQRKHSPLKGHRLCGLAVLPNRANVELNVYENGSASFNGTSTCSSPTCVSCYSQARKEHTELVENTLSRAVQIGSDVRLLTFTMKKTSLPKQIKIAQEAWKRTKSKLDREFKKINLNYSLSKAYDITFNIEQYHYAHLHIHAVLTFKRDQPEHHILKIQSILTNLKSFWCDCIIKLGGNANLASQDVTIAESTDALPRYLSKEYGFGAGKTNSLLETIAKIETECSNGDFSNIQLYKRFIRALKGLRWFSHNKHARKMAESVLGEDPEVVEPIYQISLPSKSYQGLAESGLIHRIKALVASWVLSNKADDHASLMDLEMALELDAWREYRRCVEDWSDFWSELWAQSRTSLE